MSSTATTCLTWRKSSYSGTQENCVEVAHLHWHKSSHSGSQENCVEVAHTSATILLRDSKNPGDEPLALTPSSFRALLTTLET